jgi:hypothetical protein
MTQDKKCESCSYYFVAPPLNSECLHIAFDGYVRTTDDFVAFTPPKDFGCSLWTKREEKKDE